MFKRSFPNWYKTAQYGFPTTVEELNKLNYNEMRSLAQNLSITPECQMLLITSEYEGKRYVLHFLVKNPNFLKGFSLQEKRYLLKPCKECRFRILSSRLKEVRENVGL